MSIAFKPILEVKTMKDKVVALLLLIIMLLNIFDVLSDISLGVPKWHIFEEMLVVLASGIMAIYLIVDIWQKNKKLLALKNQLIESNRALANINDEMKKARSDYSAVIIEQFKQWSLTSGEQEVAMLLLKGLSFKEISLVRDTKEKTVRQQASTIYNKSSLEGRHDLAAWFLEDFIANDQ